MDSEALYDILKDFRGCTFAAIDAETWPKKGIKKTVENERVLLFASIHGISGYANRVRRQLERCGFDPDNFHVSPLPWGTRVHGTPFITHNGRLYLQTVLLHPGTTVYKCGNYPVNPGDFGIRERPRKWSQGLPRDKEVQVSTYDVEHITRIALLGEVLTKEGYNKRGKGIHC